MSDGFWVHCAEHGRPHKVVFGACWCGVVEAEIGNEPPMQSTTLLDATTRDGALDECRRRGLWIYVPKGPTP